MIAELGVGGVDVDAAEPLRNETEKEKRREKEKSKTPRLGP